MCILVQPGWTTGAALKRRWERESSHIISKWILWFWQKITVVQNHIVCSLFHFDINYASGWIFHSECGSVACSYMISDMKEKMFKTSVITLYSAIAIDVIDKAPGKIGMKKVVNDQIFWIYWELLQIESLIAFLLSTYWQMKLPLIFRSFAL